VSEPKIARPEILTGTVEPPTGVIRPTTAEQAHRVARRDLQAVYEQRDPPPGYVHTGEPEHEAASGPLLPPGVTPLQSASLQRHAGDVVSALLDAVEQGRVSENDLQRILKAIPRDTMRRLVYEYAGMGASLLMTLNKQVALVDSVLNQLVSPDGQLKPYLGEGGPPLSLKDAMNLSVKCSQLILRDLPKVYNVERVQRLEMAIGEVMEKHLSVEQQAEVLRRLEELTPDKA
jgi:hypothetical protein